GVSCTDPKPRGGSSPVESLASAHERTFSSSSRVITEFCATPLNKQFHQRSTSGKAYWQALIWLDHQKWEASSQNSRCTGPAGICPRCSCRITSASNHE